MARKPEANDAKATVSGSGACGAATDGLAGATASGSGARGAATGVHAKTVKKTTTTYEEVVITEPYYSRNGNDDNDDEHDHGDFDDDDDRDCNDCDTVQVIVTVKRAHFKGGCKDSRPGALITPVTSVVPMCKHCLKALRRCHVHV